MQSCRISRNPSSLQIFQIGDPLDYANGKTRRAPHKHRLNIRRILRCQFILSIDRSNWRIVYRGAGKDDFVYDRLPKTEKIFYGGLAWV